MIHPIKFEYDYDRSRVYYGDFWVFLYLPYGIIAELIRLMNSGEDENEVYYYLIAERYSKEDAQSITEKLFNLK